LTRLDVDAEFALETIDDNFQVKFTHTGNNGLTGFVIIGNPKGRIFDSQTIESGTHFFLIVARLGLD